MASADFVKSVEEFSGAFGVAAALLTLACYGVFSFLIALDGWQAFRKWKTWLPGKAFALTGVTVQLIVWWTILSRAEGSKCENLLGDYGYCLSLYQIVVSGRVAVCVFIGYLLPGMAAPSVRTFVALAITICAQMITELVFILKYKENPSSASPPSPPLSGKSKVAIEDWAPVVDQLILICIVVLGLILVCTILAGKTIHGLLRQRISAIFSTKEYEFEISNDRTMSTSWNDFEDEVFTSWFVARVCQVDYVISRSVLSSAVGIVVTICVILSLLSNTSYNLHFDEWKYEETAFYSPLFSFIVTGWVVICWRWLAAQLYFRPGTRSWRRCLRVEDFWTSNVVELIHIYDLKRARQQFQDDERSRSKMSRLCKLCCFPAKIFTKFRLHKSLYLVLMLQICVVFFCKLCGFLSGVIVGEFVYWCRKHMRKGDSVALPEKYKRILECLCIPGEAPSDLWEANEVSFNKIRLRMRKGCEKGKPSDELNSIFHFYSLQWAEDGTQLLNMLRKTAMPSVLKHFPHVENQCVKITVVSLMSVFIGLHKAKSDCSRKVVKACREVWDLLSFADECDIDLQATQISLIDDLNRDKDQVCMAADMEFYKSQMEYDKLSSGCEECVVDAEATRRFLEDLLEKCEVFLKRENLLGDYKEVAEDLSDSKHWMKIAPSYSLYKLCKLMLDEDVEDFLAWTEASLRNVIAACFSRLPDMLVKQCWKWAQEFEEDKLWEAIHLVGKCRGMMEAWELKPKPTLKTTKQWIIEVEE